MFTKILYISIRGIYYQITQKGMTMAADQIQSKVSPSLQKPCAFMAMGRFENLQQVSKPEKADPFKESTKMYPGGIFTA